MTTDLKPCPFQTCGGKRILIDQSISLWFAYCTNCGARGPQRQSKAGAADAWNDRVTPPALDAAGLVAALEEITRVDPKWDAYTASRIIAVQTLRAYRAAAQPDAGDRPTGATVNELLADYTDTVQLVRQAMMKSEPILAVNQLLAACNHLADAVAQLAEERHA